jgi:RNA polymerase sigma-70 factor (ECF subfamily)
MQDGSPEIADLLRCSDPAQQVKVLADLFMRHSRRLRSLVKLRLGVHLQGRIDPSDVLQEAYLEASRRLPGYLQDPGLPFFLWLRLITGQKLVDLNRFHLRAQARDARKEVPLVAGDVPPSTSAALAAGLVNKEASPSEKAIKAETRALLEQALEGMDPLDREIVALRHVEELTNFEAARALGITAAAASKRYVRALRRLKDLLPSGQ